MAFFSSLQHRISHISSVSVFDWSVRIFLLFIPFSSFVSVFLTYRLGMSGASLIKEAILVIMALALVYTYIRSYFGDKQYLLRLTKFDYLIFVYIALLITISLTTTGIRGIVFGGRYDFSFLLTFFVAYHGFPLLTKPISYYIKLFLLSAGAMIFISGLLKWPLNEDMLLYFGYSGNPSVWDFGGAPPIFQGIDGANVRRLQGLLDGPNSMGAFLILYSGIFAYFTRFRREWYFVISIILIGLLGMVFYTYSRSALIGIFLAYTIVLVLSLSSLWRFYRAQLVSVFILLSIGALAIGVVYYDRALAIVARAGSTQGHAERMITGINRTLAHPLGQGLASAGPGYRYVVDLTGKNPDQVRELDSYYIPESWYIQQFIEGGILGGLLFLAIILSLFVLLFRIHPILAALFAGVSSMNLFLHTFESSAVSLSLFFLIGLFIAYGKHAKK